MSDEIKHECAVTLLRLRKPPEYYLRKYGTSFYGYHKIALMLEKQHNRGQDGAGIACLRLNPEPGTPPYSIEKSNKKMPLAAVIEAISNRPREDFQGSLYLGHLRYGTFGGQTLDACHPFVRENPCLNRLLLLAGNFNLTDAKDIYDELIASGHFPTSRSDGYLILQLIGHYLDRARNQPAFDLNRVLQESIASFDGAFTLCGMVGDGTSFAIRDAHGIRPGYYYFDDEIAVVASERPAIQAAFDRTTAEVHELPPGEALIIDADGKVHFEHCLKPQTIRQCVFERIYFSRSNDADIHRERKALGRALAPQILDAVGHDFDNTLFSYIPNTAQVAFHGLLETLNHSAFAAGKEVRFGQIAIKDAKFRTFISDAASRKEFYMHVYDITYGLVRPGSDNLVVLDDSIVRGNTMRNAILPMLERLSPKKIVIASSAPPIKYPDCYGIDMATMQELVAFDAAVLLLRRHNRLDLLDSCYSKAREQLRRNVPAEMTNCVRPIYDAFPEAELISAIAELLRPEDMKAELDVVFQSCENLRTCCPNHLGDWYFTGDYPTPGGFRVVNQALVNYMEHNEQRAY